MKRCLLCDRTFEGAGCPFCGECTFIEVEGVLEQGPAPVSVPEPAPEPRKRRK